MPKEVKKLPKPRVAPKKVRAIVRTKKAPTSPIRTVRKKTVAESVSENVQMPHTPSVRLLEKAALYQQWYDEVLPQYAKNTATAGGYTFLCTALILAAFHVFSVQSSTLTGAAICTQGLCSELPPSALPDSAPSVTFNNSLPEVLTDAIDFTLTTQQHIDVFVIDMRSKRETLIPSMSSVSNDTYTYIIDPTLLEAGQYVVVARAQQSDVSYEFTGPGFTIPSSETIVESLPEESLLPSVSTDSVDIASTTEILESADNEDLPVLAAVTASSTTEAIDEEVAEDVVESVVAPLTTPHVRISTVNDSTYAVVTTPGFTPSRVEVYASYGEALRVYIGAAEYVDGEWWISLDAYNLPQREAIITASFVEKGTTVTTSGIAYTSTLSANAPTVTDDFEISIYKAKVEAALSVASLPVTDRTSFTAFFDGSSSAVFNENSLATDDSIAAADRILAESQAFIDAYLLAYSSALLSTNKQFVQPLETAISQVAHTLTSGQADIAEEEKGVIATIITIRLTETMAQVRRYTESVITATNGLITQDSDIDGLADYDELALYASNPTVADTDNDGVLDSVEILPSSIAGDITIQTINLEVSTKVQAKGGTKTILPVVSGTTIPNSHILISHNNATHVLLKAGITGEFITTLDIPLDSTTHTFSAAVLTPQDARIITYTTPTLALADSKLVGERALSASVLDGTATPSPLYRVISVLSLAMLGFILLYLAYAVHFQTELLRCTRTKKPLL